mgnify:CR=1 FL=1
MRLGDVDKLLYHKRKVMFFGLVPDDECWGFAVPVEEIDKAPTIDAVPVVRCRECQHYDHGCCVVKRYEGDDNIIAMPPDGYCSYGQRKEDGHDKYPSDPV